MNAPQPVLEGSNAIYLSGRQWLGLAVFLVAVFLLTPIAWRRAETIEPHPDYRIPFSLSNDYWLWSRVAEREAASHDTVLLGDSVVWGVYVRPGETLSHYLNSLEGKDRYANLGVNGAQPIALAGLVESYGGAIRNKRVLLHCNPLWMSSPKRDLRETEEMTFNHSELAPQFVPRIPSYRKSVSERIDRVIDRNVEFRAWTSHLQNAYFGENGVPRPIPDWMLDHPYDNPFKAVTLKVPPPGEELQQEPIPWIGRIPPENMAWVDLAGSIQWKSFQRTVDLLQARGNTVLVLVGPFNEHLLKAPSRVRYSELKKGIEAWLLERRIQYLAPDPLPSEQYGDASHPLSAGYALLAERLQTSGILK
jgi:hypothetical protein